MTPTGRYELRVSIPSASREDAMGLAERVWDEVCVHANAVVVFEEQTEPKLVQCGSIGTGTPR